MTTTNHENDLSSSLARATRGAAGFLRTARAGSRALTRLGLTSAVLLGLALALQALDPRVVSGVSAWLKPAKFAASVSMVSFTLAWVIQRLGGAEGDRGLRRAAAVMAAMGALELAIIVAQAARGVPSHFNVRTSLDRTLFGVMGAGITLFWLAEMFIAFRAFRHGFADAALGWGIRLGLVAALLGGAVAFLMPRPTPAQLATLRAAQPTPAVGAHSVGVPDGGPGLPGTHWSTQGGDLRVPHFFGLHGLQVLPFVAWWLSRRRAPAARPRPDAARQTIAVAIGYLGLTAVTLIQALRAQPLLAPDAWTVGSALVVVAGTGLALAVSSGRFSRLTAGQRSTATRSPKICSMRASRSSDAATL